MTGFVSYSDIACAMNRSDSVVKTWASLSRPKAMPWVNIRVGSSKQPAHFYPIEDTISWLIRAYSHFDARVETRLRAIAKENEEKYPNV